MGIKHAVIAAAGTGSRLSMGMPKCLIEVSGRKIIDYQLDLLKDIEDVRIVVGYKSDEVIKYVKSIRSDIKFIVNSEFSSTNTLQSFYMGCEDINEFCIIFDGDIIFNKISFYEFIEGYMNGNKENIIGITEVNTEDAVFVKTERMYGENYITSFDRSYKTNYEWANVAVIHTSLLEYKPTYVFEQLQKYLPIKCKVIDRLEIDTISDLEYAIDRITSDKNNRFD